MTRSPSFRDGFVDRLSGFSFLPPYYPSYRALVSTLARLSSLNAPAFRWTHLHAGLARRTVTTIFRQLTQRRISLCYETLADSRWLSRRSGGQLCALVHSPLRLRRRRRL